MKYLLFFLMLQGLAYGKVQDFNNIINEDIKAQKDLHSQFNKQIQVNMAAQDSKRPVKTAKVKEIIVVENSQTNYTAPSDKNFLKFNKEVRQKKQNERKNQHRVAKEIKDLEM